MGDIKIMNKCSLSVIYKGWKDGTGWGEEKTISHLGTDEIPTSKYDYVFFQLTTPAAFRLCLNMETENGNTDNGACIDIAYHDMKNGREKFWEYSRARSTEDKNFNIIFKD